MNKAIVLFFFYILFFIAYLFQGGLGLQRPQMASYNLIEERITFEKDIKTIMNTSCGGVFCHHGKPSTWTNYKTVKASLNSGIFYERVIEKRDMPKRKPLPESEYQTIKKWLENGALEK